MQNAIRDGVQSELDKRGVGGGGGGNDRLAKLERDVALIQATIVTRESLHVEIAKARADITGEISGLKIDLARLPLTFLKWLGGAVAALVGLATLIWRLFG